jgi:DNA polymerase III alpha subunit (gram-positive type)
MPRRKPFVCPSCRSDDVITIQMTQAGSELSFSTCHDCETKWWHKDGESVDLSSVLGAVATR